MGPLEAMGPLEGAPKLGPFEDIGGQEPFP